MTHENIKKNYILIRMKNTKREWNYAKPLSKMKKWRKLHWRIHNDNNTNNHNGNGTNEKWWSKLLLKTEKTEKTVFPLCIHLLPFQFRLFFPLLRGTSLFRPDPTRSFATATTMTTATIGQKERREFGLWCCVVCLAICASVCGAARSDKETRERFYGNIVNLTSPESNNTLAKMFDRVLEKEFSENDQTEGFVFPFSQQNVILFCSLKFCFLF